MKELQRLVDKNFTFNFYSHGHNYMGYSYRGIAPKEAKSNLGRQRYALFGEAGMKLGTSDDLIISIAVEENESELLEFEYIRIWSIDFTRQWEAELGMGNLSLRAAFRAIICEALIKEYINRGLVGLIRMYNNNDKSGIYSIKCSGYGRGLVGVFSKEK